MPQTLIVDIEWSEKYAWLPVKSSWSKKCIWLNKYWHGAVYYDTMGRPPLKGNCWKLIYSENEYLMYLLRSSSRQKTSVELLPYGKPKDS